MANNTDQPIMLGTFGKRLRMVRGERGITQDELRAEMERRCNVRIGQTYISVLEGSDRTPTLEVASAMAEVLGVSLDYFGLLIDQPRPFDSASAPAAPVPQPVS